MKRAHRRAGPLLAALALVACRGQIRFDEHPLDGGAGMDARSDCDSGLCGFEIEACDATRCEIECQPGRICSGVCGPPACAVECEQESRCTVSTHDRSSVRCERDTRCDLRLGSEGSANCDDGALCTVRCLGACSLRCAAGATCTLQCNSETSARPVSGNASCP